ncbi:acyltransferase family protein [Thermotoga sp. KOL6]|uniref:acyltransferase family protein n=1 Tax=Thermotoga sp. KOL6 TaxID=126741 RepID=UPI000C786B88|nr:acyltransferase family protein [Thermotoga sp. KOL6]PLV59906.1 hypothetical protein AS005_01005 [Thermotoga sp. KOL6]
MESLKGLLILFVVSAHAIMSVYEDLTPFLPVLRFMGPCVFVFVYLFGYSQGKVKKNPLKILKKALMFFLFYSFWASLSFLLYTTLGGRYSEVWTTQRVFNINDSLLKKYLITLFSFTGSWQYYFVFVFLVLVILSILINNPVKIFPLSLIGALLNSAFVSFWFLTKDKLLPPIEGAFITYLSPVHWSFPYLLGYRDAYKGERPSLKKRVLFFYAVFLIVGSLEYWNAYRKFHSLVGIDQFSLLGIALGIYSVGIFYWIAQKMNFRVLRKVGRYSFLLFMIHMPFQWMVYVFLDTFIDLPRFLWVILMVTFSVMMMDILLKISRHLPKAVRKLIVGV